jgi:hypothetical protein
MRRYFFVMALTCYIGCAVTAPVNPVDPSQPIHHVDPDPTPTQFNPVEFSAELAHQAELANSDPAFKSSELLDGILTHGGAIGVPEDYCKRVRAACPAIGRKPASDISADDVNAIMGVK